VSCVQQQIGDQCLWAGVLVKVAVPSSGDGLAHRVDRFVKPAELLVGIRELVEVLRAVRLRLRQFERARDQANARVVVITLAGDIEFALDRGKVSHALKASLSARRGDPPLGDGSSRRLKRGKEKVAATRIWCA
jgi:hypothetical protein